MLSVIQKAISGVPMPTVFNRYKDIGKLGFQDAVNIMRPSKWGNCFSHQYNAWVEVQNRCASRKEAVDRYEQMVLANPKMIAEIKRELRGKDLVCCCAPLICHGDILLRIANE